MALDPETLAGMPLDASGLGAAVSSLVDGNKLDLEAEQAELFASSPLLAGRDDLTPARKAGRPIGAGNKTTEEWRAFFMRSYRSPLFFLGDLITADPFKLHAEIVKSDITAKLERSVSVLAVINAQRAAAEALAPYLHRKQPIAIDTGDDKSVPLFQQIVVGAEAMARMFPQAAGKADDLAYTPAALEGEVAGAKSHDGAASDASD